MLNRAPDTSGLSLRETALSVTVESQCKPEITLGLGFKGGMWVKTLIPYRR